MSDELTRFPWSESGPPTSITPFIKAIKSRDLEALRTLRHALRTPLNQIIGYSEMLMESAEENNITALLVDLKRIHTAGNQLLSIISDGLAPWKIETGKIDFPTMRRDVRTPLSTVIGYAELCLDETRLAEAAEQTKDLEKILRAATQLHSLFESDAYPDQMDTTAAPVGNEEAEEELPIPAAALRQAPQTPTDLGGTVPPLPNARVLAVDDDRTNREMLVRRLQKLGYEVEEAATGREALTKLAESKFDLVLLDIIMPDLDGFETLEIIKNDPRLRHLPIIMLTALDDVESNVRCVEAGAEDYVAKPFNPTILRARISASLEKKRLRDIEQDLLDKLHLEQAKSERLLHNILPKAIAERLKNGERNIVNNYIDSTVLFSDIVGFTRHAKKQSAQRTVQFLNDIFSNFDRIAEQFELEKIKTIGDAYMLVSGVPTIRPDHAEACANAAFEMLEAVRLFNRRHGLDWHIRIGMNSGPVAAGIIGTKKFSYDLWGDTVNIASRMESRGQTDQVQVSEATMKLLGSNYDFEPQGEIDIKSDKLMLAFLVKRKPSKTSRAPWTTPPV